MSTLGLDRSESTEVTKPRSRKGLAVGMIFAILAIAFAMNLGCPAFASAQTKTKAPSITVVTKVVTTTTTTNADGKTVVREEVETVDSAKSRDAGKLELALAKEETKRVKAKANASRPIDPCPWYFGGCAAPIGYGYSSTYIQTGVAYSLPYNPPYTAGGVASQRRSTTSHVGDVAVPRPVNTGASSPSSGGGTYTRPR